MHIGLALLELNIPGVTSLKEKRGRIKSLKKRLHREFNVSVAEVALHDVWQSTSIAVAIVSTNAAHAGAVLDAVVIWIEEHRPDLDIVAVETEVEPW